MLSFGLGSALIGATVAIHVDNSTGLSASDQAALLADLEAAITACSGAATIVDEAGCDDVTPCGNQVLARTGAERLVFVQLVGVPSRIRVVAQTAPDGAGATWQGRVDLERSRDRWPAALIEFVRPLFADLRRLDLAVSPPASPAAAPTAVPSEVTTAAEASPWPWVMLGGSLVLAGVGGAFGAVSRNARAAGDGGLRTPEAERLESRAIANGWAANVLWSTAGVAAVSGIVWLFVE